MTDSDVISAMRAWCSLYESVSLYLSSTVTAAPLIVYTLISRAWCAREWSGRVVVAVGILGILLGIAFAVGGGLHVVRHLVLKRELRPVKARKLRALAEGNTVNLARSHTSARPRSD